MVGAVESAGQVLALSPGDKLIVDAYPTRVRYEWGPVISTFRTTDESAGICHGSIQGYIPGTVTLSPLVGSVYVTVAWS